jgi:UDP-glucose 4-epimerase
MSTKILVVGGGGYIGSHMLLMLRDAGLETVVLDNFSTGYRDAIHWGTVVEGDMADRALLHSLFSTHQIDAVMHFASFIQVGESVQKPAAYYDNNVAKTLVLLDAMREHGVDKFIFSSTAAIFGVPAYTPIDEAHPKQPLNPYGASKLMVEQILDDYAHAYGLKFAALRYFNAAGADPETRVGERHQPETHLIPLAIRAALGRLPQLQLFGTDFDTRDGTCIRDYVHINDICHAHLLALDHLGKKGTSLKLNLGNGQGYSVREVIQTVETLTTRKINVITAPRRAGDSPTLVADATSAHKLIGWQPRYPALETIVRHALSWEMRT